MSNLPVFKAMFNVNLTESALIDLAGKYPSDIVYNMKDDVVFKLARKSRTERNNLTKAINKTRIDAGNELKDYGDDLINSVESVFSNIVSQFESEDKARKDEAMIKKQAYDDLIASERAKISKISKMTLDVSGQESSVIANAIEALSMIEPSSFHKDVIHEAISAIDDVSASLAQMRIDAISREKLKAERAQFAKDREELEKQQAELRRQAAILAESQAVAQSQIESTQEEQAPMFEATRPMAPPMTPPIPPISAPLVHGDPTGDLSIDLASWSTHYEIESDAFEQLIFILNRNGINQ